MKGIEFVYAAWIKLNTQQREAALQTEHEDFQKKQPHVDPGRQKVKYLRNIRLSLVCIKSIDDEVVCWTIGNMINRTS